jgi:hypothetical protein
MNDQRFKELLNLYLDHRLSDAEATELERALRADASRRKVLRDYSLIQGGCSELFSRAAARAPSSAALCRSLHNVEARMSRVGAGQSSSAWNWRAWSAGWGVAGAGLAACATILIVVRSGSPDGQVPVDVAAAAAPSLATSPAEPAPISLAATAPVATPVAVAGAEVVSERQKARNLTLAALGLTMDEPATLRAGKQWADARETYELANLSPAARSWIIATSAAEGSWAQAQSASLTMQTASGNGWTHATPSAYQVDPVAYRYER